MPSAREQVAQALADTCVFGGLNDSYGVSLSKQKDAKGKTYWAITFCKARTLDGAIKVYSPNFILISWASGYTNREVCKSEAAAKELLMKFIR